jgi:aryl-phospho-beta-D-glucosidase BglC (GH1 family)
VNKLFNKFGTERTIEIMTEHRESYITSEDFKAMAANGITRVRLPLGWWAFIEESLSSTPLLVTDPAHTDRQFITIPRAFLLQVLRQAQAAGLEVLLDIHAFPGGSADGSYNGVYPNTPMFFKDEALQQQGFDIIAALCDFYISLDDSLRATVTGVTLMNEPAHLIQDDSDAMIAWMKSAVEIFREKIVKPYDHHPALFVNLIGTSISDQGMLDFMVETFSATELSEWAILDVHVYYAWSGGDSGCTV